MNGVGRHGVAVPADRRPIEPHVSDWHHKNGREGIEKEAPDQFGMELVTRRSLAHHHETSRSVVP